MVFIDVQAPFFALRDDGTPGMRGIFIFSWNRISQEQQWYMLLTH